jgi:ferric-dicitrate binding protein FerR (iron transport regulator)
MNEYREYELMAGMLNGELNKDEQEELQQWLEESREHREIFANMQEIHAVAKETRPAFSTDVERALRAAKRGKRIERTRRWKVLSRYAAVALLALGAGWWVYPGEEKRGDDDRSFEVVAVPGRARAILRQGDGTGVTLDDLSRDTLLSSRGGVTVAVKEGGLVYSTSAVESADAEMNEVIVPRGGEFQLVLPDGTVARLNAETRVLFPRRFAADERRVLLSGEAYFEVTRDEARPFIVEAPGMEVRVLGTRFNVSAYPLDEARHATLAGGRVEVSVPGQSPVTLLPGEQLYLRGGQVEKREVNAETYLSWMNGHFVFRDAGLDEIARQLSRWYDAEIVFADETLKEIRFTGGIVRSDPVETLIRAIEATSQARFRVEGKQLVIYK